MITIVVCLLRGTGYRYNFFFVRSSLLLLGFQLLRHNIGQHARLPLDPWMAIQVLGPVVAHEQAHHIRRH